MTQTPTIFDAEAVLNRLLAPRYPPTRPTALPRRRPESLRRGLVLKRVADYSIAATLSILTAPLIGVCALLIRLTSRGPAFYSQERVGQFGRVFTIYKLRSMYHQCERTTGPQWSLPGDPRITPIGRILRATHVDELPQLVNVLCGHMSLVGPRPERPEIAALLALEIEDYDARSAVLPGITGHAQVNLPPECTLQDAIEKVRLDRHYIGRWSAWFDVLTLCRTALKVVGLRRPGRWARRSP